MSALSKDSIALTRELEGFSACEVSDALIALEDAAEGQIRHGGFLDGLCTLDASYV